MIILILMIMIVTNIITLLVGRWRYWNDPTYWKIIAMAMMAANFILIICLNAIFLIADKLLNLFGV